MASIKPAGASSLRSRRRRIAGEIALMMPPADAIKAEGYFDRALAIARARRAKSWELRAAMSMARGPRSARPGLRLVHRRVRHARPERGQGLARRGEHAVRR